MACTQDCAGLSALTPPPHIRHQDLTTRYGPPDRSHHVLVRTLTQDGRVVLTTRPPTPTHDTLVTHGSLFPTDSQRKEPELMPRGGTLRSHPSCSRPAKEPLVRCLSQKVCSSAAPGRGDSVSRSWFAHFTTTFPLAQQQPTHLCTLSSVRTSLRQPAELTVTVMTALAQAPL